VKKATQVIKKNNDENTKQTFTIRIRVRGGHFLGLTAKMKKLRDLKRMKDRSKTLIELHDDICLEDDEEEEMQDDLLFMSKV
jgi:hypothetical protein